MCGIAGMISVGEKAVEIASLQRMTQALAHRGPDDESHWKSDNGFVGLGHRRLAIIDLAASGNQPMQYTGRYHIVFNGAIYNYIELKSDLIQQGFSFSTHTDTEVLLAMYARYKEDCLEKLDGMFSFLIYDEQEESVFAATDRFGEKPFFYHFAPGQHLIFASEMKGLWAAGVEKSINQSMLFNYLTRGYVINPAQLSETFYTGCTRLPHSHFLKMNLKEGILKIKKYYDIDIANSSNTVRFEEASEEFKSLFHSSLQRRLRCDVPLGCSLSGGLDSSVIVCALDRLSKNKQEPNTKLKTFSARNPGFIRDEGKYIDQVIAHTSIDPIAVFPEAKEMAMRLDEVFYFQEEPFGDAGILMQYLVMESAKKNGVKVLLDGQGADEILAGYHHYFPAFLNGLKKRDAVLARKEQLAYEKLYPHNTLNSISKNSLPSIIRQHLPDQVNRFKQLRTAWEQLIRKELNPDFFATYKDQGFELNFKAPDLNHAMYQQAFHGDLQSRLRFADRNSMAHARELRLPYLSHYLVDFMYRLPDTYKIHQGCTKYILRKSFQSILPPEIYNRKDKVGYESPQETWMAEKNMSDKIMDAREKLIEHRILNKKWLSKKPIPHGSYVAGDKSWRHLMSACVLS